LCQIKRAMAIIGAGIVGLAVGLEVSRQNPGLRVIVVEKESEVASHQTGHNSGVIHSGLYYKPGSLKARLCVEGAAAMVNFCETHNIPYEICGKVIVATEERELPALAELLRRGQANGVPRIRELTAVHAIREIEPNAAGLRGLHVPGTGITDFRAVSLKLADLIRESGGEILTGWCVKGLRSLSQSVVLETTSGAIQADFAVNCAGLQSDRIAKLAGSEIRLRIVPFRGEYYDLVRSRSHLIKALLYPVPDPQFPFLGVHFTRRVRGGVEAWRPARMLSSPLSAKDTGEHLLTSRIHYPPSHSPVSGRWQRTTGEAVSRSFIALGASPHLLTRCKDYYLC
jgi:(S)-2-hydroxyglutarate dehydrogenase